MKYFVTIISVMKNFRYQFKRDKRVQDFIIFLQVNERNTVGQCFNPPNLGKMCYLGAARTFSHRIYYFINSLFTYLLLPLSRKLFVVSGITS